MDAAQLVAHRKVDMAGSGIDYLAFSAHKAYAPFGTGVLVARKGLLAFSPAEMERIRSAGEENVGGIAAVPPWAGRLQRLILTVLRRFELPGVVRVSLGIENSEADVDTLLSVLDDIARQRKAGPAERVVRQQIDDSCKASAERVYGQ